jgi:hypothetical protein
MAKILCAMKSALGIRSAENSSFWRWVHYHHI